MIKRAIPLTMQDHCRYVQMRPGTPAYKTTHNYLDAVSKPLSSSRAPNSVASRRSSLPLAILPIAPAAQRSVLTPASTPGPLTPDLLVLIRFGVSHAQELRARPLPIPRIRILWQQQRASHADDRTTSQVFRFTFPGIRTIHEK